MDDETSSRIRPPEGNVTDGVTQEETGPYDEIEMYLNKAKEDIFIALKSSSVDYLQIDSENDTKSKPSADNLSPSNRTKIIKSPKSKFFENPSPRSKFPPRSPRVKRKLVTYRKPRKFGLTHDHRRPCSLKDPKLQEWSKGLLKDFQNIVEEELKSLSLPALEKEEYLPVTKSSSYFSNGYHDTARNRKARVSGEPVKYNSGDIEQNVNYATSNKLKMGGNQSALKMSENWGDEYSPYRTYTLPRPNQRSISLVGERLASSGHPDGENESCKLISMTQHRFSRSHSLDEGRGLSPWALHHLHLIDEVHQNNRETGFIPDPRISLPEGIYGKIRKTGVCQIDNEKFLNKKIKGNSSLQDMKRLSNGWTTQKGLVSNSTVVGRESDAIGQDPNLVRQDLKLSEQDSDLDKSFRETRRSSITSGTSSALTVEALGEYGGEKWVYVDDEGSGSLTDRVYDDSEEIEGNNSASQLFKPEIVITSPDINRLENVQNHAHMTATEAVDTPEDKSKQRKLREGSGRRSEPTFPSPRDVPASPLLGLPGLEVRRHTLPNPANKNGACPGANTLTLDVPGTPIFNTSSWETLPPAEEMEVMEDKPIQVDGNYHLSLERPSSRTKSFTSSRSLNSSLSSLSQLSVQDDFSENELWSPCSKSPDSKSSNSIEDLLVENNLSPEVFLDPSLMYSHRTTNECLNNLNKDRDQLKEEENSLKGIFVDTKPIIIKLSPKVIKDVRIMPEDFSDTRKIFHETRSSLLKNILVKEPIEQPKASLKDKNMEPFKGGYEKTNNSPPSSPELISGVLQLTPISRSSNNEMMFSVAIPEISSSLKESFEKEVESDSCNNTLDRRKSNNHSSPSISDHSSKDNLDDANKLNENFEPLVITENEFSGNSKLDKSVSSILSEIVDVSEAKNKNICDDDDKIESENDDVILPPLKQTSQSEKRKRNSKSKSGSKGTFADLQLFLKEVETRIPSSKDIVCSNSFESVLSPVTPSSVLSQSSGEILSFSPCSPTVVLDASTQTSFSPTTPVCGSPTFSFTWMSECGCDRASLEPCASSMALSGTEYDLDEEDDCDDDEEDDWWVTEGSLSSSPPETPVSPTRDDSSLSLSESLDNLDQNVESGIGTVSTRPSASPPVNSGALDLSGSNLSSEDTGLETSFERRVRRYLPNARCGKSSDHSFHYRRRRPRVRQPDCWVRRENQTTQTELQPLINAMSPDKLEIGREIRASSEEAQRSWKSSENQGEQLVRHTHSEPRLTAYSNHNLSLRVVNSEAALPPLPHNHSRSFCNPYPLPTLSEGKSVSKAHFSRPRNLSLGEVHVPSKAVSVPLLERGGLLSPLSVSAISPSDESLLDTPFIPTRTQSEKEISEIEALEACKWLRAAGFPQYAQMYEDFQFPLDLVSVERDHSFLDVDSLQALFRRLRVLNRCAKIRLDSAKKTNAEDSEDDEQQCALSGNWTFQRHSRRWSRIDTTQLQIPQKGVDLRACGSDRVRGISEGSDEVNAGQFKRSGSERLKDGAKAFLLRMESLKNKKKRRHREGIVISSPKVLDEALMQERVAELGCIDISLEASPEMSQRDKSSHRDTRDRGDSRVDSHTSRDSRQTTPGEDSSSLASDQSQNSTPRFRPRRRKRFWKKGFSGDGVNGGDGEGMGMGVGAAYSDSECSPPTWRHCISDANCNTKIGSFAQDLMLPSPENILDKPRPNLRHATSLTYGKESQKIRENFISSLRGVSKPSDDGEGVSPKDIRDERDERHSIYDNVPLVICNKSYHDYQSEGTDVDMVTQEGSGSSECTMESRESPLPSNHEEENEERPIRRGTVDRWHSFNRKSSSFSLYHRIGTHISGFSVGQMNHLRKRALLKLTALMERHCPTNRTTWNWELPKFIRKIKSPDYKDRIVFGVPLQVINQRTGYPLPPGIQHAFTYLKTNCIDQIGIFRKPGVRPRIQKLRELHEGDDDIQYSNFGPCDIADMVKTYFRELPEVLVTNKLSEILITICQYLPIEVRLEALQCVMLMMPDENREVLMALLSFLSDVAANAHLNQMTASNLAVCMAPSLFHLNMGGSGSSPLRRKTTGSPEQKDLHDNKAAHQCLTLMIQQVSNLQCVPMEMLANCRFSFLDLSQPVALEDLGSASNVTLFPSQGEGDWMSYMNACIDSLLKETREKSRGWVHISYPDPIVEVGYRKVGDGHPLRLWKVTTEVEAPPTELLTRVLIERCWRTDLGKGLCVVVETSVEHCDAPLLVGSTRGIVLASRYIIQPCGSGKSRITHISRVDMRGRLPEWYNKNYAFFTANHIVKLRQSFQHFATGPESKV